MSLLFLGVVLWSLVHLLPAMTPAFRAGVIARLGVGPYKGIFSLLILLSIVLMVIGWRTNELPAGMYAPPSWAAIPVLAIVLLGFILMVAASAPTNIKRVIRHPQLSGVTLWALAHLLANGDSRSLVLFGGLAVWAVVAMLLINRRDGVWIKPGSVSLAKDVTTVVIGVVVFVVFSFAHPWLSGMPLGIWAGI